MRPTAAQGGTAFELDYINMRTNAIRKYRR
jgi:hypothetical protein